MFNNLGRQIVDSAITSMSRGVLKKKKKDLVRIMEREGDNTAKYLMDVANRMREGTAFEKNKSGFAVALDYKKATHYFVSELPPVVTLTADKNLNRLKLIDSLDDIFTIETNSGDVSIFAQFFNMEKDVLEPGDIFIDDKKVIWSFNVFLKADTSNVCPVHYPLFCGYIAEDWEDVFFIANDYHPLTKAFETKKASFKFEDVSYSISAIVPGKKKAALVTSTFEHLLDCTTVLYKEIHGVKSEKTEAEQTSEFVADFLNRALKGEFDKPEKSGEVKERAISVAKEAKIEVEVEDKLVPLHRYIKEYSPSIKRVHKGGHHASPTPHDRRGFYRKSRGRGDYDLINGEFVYVGNKEGSYSWVPATHVGKKTNSKPTLIYKV